MKNIADFTETEYNEFDAPIPGQSLTDTPGNAPWEHPPQITDPEEVLQSLYDKITNGEFTEQLIAMLDAGVPVEAVTRVIIFGGFMQGKYTPDVGFLIAEPIMKLIAAVGIRAGVKKLSDMAELKAAGEEVSQISEEIKEELPQPEAGPGLLARPQPQGVA
jgi:hypothetical protein